VPAVEHVRALAAAAERHGLKALREGFSGESR
jgi:hypothetical protein